MQSVRVMSVIGSLCLLVLVACSPRITRTTIAPTVTVTVAPTLITPNPLATRTPQSFEPFTPIICSDAPQSRLIVLERGQVSDNGEPLNLRAGPGTDFDVLDQLEPLDIFLILDGPVCAETYTWYRVEFEEQVGWIAEGDLREYYAEPYLSG